MVVPAATINVCLASFPALSVSGNSTRSSHLQQVLTMTRQNYSTGTPWESAVGYSRAVRADRHIFVSGTTASAVDGSTVCAQDAAGQTRFVLLKIEAALQALGATLADVVRTRMYVIDISMWEDIGRVHREFFAETCPAATLVEVSRLTSPDHLVEIEVDAFLCEI